MEGSAQILHSWLNLLVGEVGGERDVSGENPSQGDTHHTGVSGANQSKKKLIRKLCGCVCVRVRSDFIKIAWKRGEGGRWEGEKLVCCLKKWIQSYQKQ